MAREDSPRHAAFAFVYTPFVIHDLPVQFASSPSTTLHFYLFAAASIRVAWEGALRRRQQRRQGGQHYSVEAAGWLRSSKERKGNREMCTYGFAAEQEDFVGSRLRFVRLLVNRDHGQVVAGYKLC